jgi:PAS domain S-box-containing protein
MSAHSQTHEEVLQELVSLRLRVAELESSALTQSEPATHDRELLHKHALEALQRERTRAQLYFQTAGVMLLVVDVDGNITRLNRKGHEILGYADGELLGESWFQCGLPDGERDAARHRFQQLMAGQGELAESCESTVRTRLGPCRLIAWHHTLLVDEQGRRDGVLSSGTDITEQREAEEQLRRGRDELDQRVRERTVEWMDANSRLRQEIEERRHAQEALQREREALRKLLDADDRERQLVAHDLHHGLSQMLVAAKLYFEAYQRARERGDEEQDSLYATGRQMLQESLDEARRLCGHVYHVTVDQRGLVAAIADFLQDTGSEDGIVYEFQPDIAFQRLDAPLEKALVRIVQEGVTNARRHSLTAKVRIELQQHDDRLRLEIRDWGVGFRPDELGNGGFGLEGMRARARLHGGTTLIHSACGQGTQIVVDLPVQLPTEKAPRDA